MYPAPFEYYRATSVADAIGRLAANPDARLIAGGHSLIPAMKLRLATPAELVDLADLGDLRGIALDGNGATIGAMTTYNEARDHPGLASAYPIIPQAIRTIGDQQVRARGTLGGSLAHNDPAADFTAVFCALDGSVTVVGADGERTIPAGELFVDLWTTSLAAGEVLTTIHLPALAAGTAMAYEKHAHPASGYAIAGVAVVVLRNGDTIAGARIAVTGATSIPTRAGAAEAALVGQPLNADTIAAAGAAAAEGLEINGDHFASADYRAHLVRVLTRRALERAVQVP